MDNATLIERLRGCPDIANARIVAPGGRVPEVIVPASVRDEAADRIAALEKRLEVVPGNGESVDGIACRDETIKLLDRRIAALEAEVKRLLEALENK